MIKIYGFSAIASMLAFPSMATTINFDNLANGTIVTNQYAGVTFSSSPGSDVIVSAQNIGNSPPNFICSGVGGTINCADPVYVTFSTLVSGLSFSAIGDNMAGVNGNVAVFGNGGALLGNVSIFGDNVFLTPYKVDLSAFSGISQIAITNIDPGGLGYDDFTFNAGPSAVPEPASWAMMIGGFGMVGAAMRRRVRVSFA